MLVVRLERHRLTLGVMAQILFCLLSHLLVEVVAVLVAHQIETVLMVVLVAAQVVQAVQLLVLGTLQAHLHHRETMVELLE